MTTTPESEIRSVIERYAAAWRDGKLAECWVYDQDQAVIDRLIGPA
jgi:hypothetical protein